MELLERIAESSGYLYVSDLHWGTEWKLILKQMKKEDIRSYSLEEWEKVMRYLNSEDQAEVSSYEKVEEWIREA